MQQTISFLHVIDRKHKPSPHHKTLFNIRDKISKRSHRYPYAKAIDFSEDKYSTYPKWLIEKEGFSDFMYKNYENKLMSIPKICQKNVRASDQKYFVSLFLEQIDIFKNLPSTINEIILENIKTKYYKTGEIVHYETDAPGFMGVIFVGVVHYKTAKNPVTKHKNQVILTQAFHGEHHQTIFCQEEAIILTLSKSVYQLIKNKLKEDIQTKERDEISDMMKSIFFSELHIKDKKARNFYNDFQLQFFFKGQVIENAGASAGKFYMIYKGEVIEQNHIYVRQHNKWPLPNRKWEVRAVYNSYHKSNLLRQNNFFGDQEIISNSKFKSKYVASTWVIVFSMDRQNFLKNLTSEDLKRLKKYRTENIDINYTDFQNDIRNRVKSQTQRKKIVLKAINTSLAHKSQFSPRKMSLINSFQKSMLKSPFFEQTHNL